jgi:uncharacterized membrane protein SpoIIM required for sporulation
MRVADLLEERRSNWRDLEQLCSALESRKARRMSGKQISRFAALYRGVCADLALADAYHLPPTTVDYLHQLVGRAHNQLYRSRRFRIKAWAEELLFGVPGRLYRDGCLRLAFFLFYGVFALSMFLGSAASPYPKFAEETVGQEFLTMMEEMYNESPTSRDFDSGSFMTSFYTFHNTTIGLRVFAYGLLLGVGGVYETIHNAQILGAMEGYMSTVPQRDNFCHFVTAHGPFELTAILLSAAAGMRLGFALVLTGGLTRGDSVRRAGTQAMPAMGAAIVLFLLAAFIEGYISPSSLPYEVKAAVGAVSAGILMVYFVMLGNLATRTTPNSSLTGP